MKKLTSMVLVSSLAVASASFAAGNGPSDAQMNGAADILGATNTIFMQIDLGKLRGFNGLSPAQSEKNGHFLAKKAIAKALGNQSPNADVNIKNVDDNHFVVSGKINGTSATFDCVNKGNKVLTIKCVKRTS